MSLQYRVRKIIKKGRNNFQAIKCKKNVGDLSVEYDMAASTINTILKNEEEIRSLQVADRISRLSSSRCNITEQMETLLLVWINEKQMAGDSVSEAIIFEKVKQLFEELGAKAPSTSTGPVKEFFGTKGWFTGIRERAGLHSIVRHAEAASRERDAAEQHREKFKKILEEGGLCFALLEGQKSRIKQSILDSYFKKVDKRPPTYEPPTGQSRKLSRKMTPLPPTPCDILRFLLGKVCLYFHWGRLFMLFVCIRFLCLL